jgi:hypothetical protein
MITSTMEGSFMHWEGMSLSDLLEVEDRLVAHLEPLPFQEGRPLATTVEESTELVDASFDDLASRQVLMAEEGEDDGDFPIVEFDVVSEDEVTANTDDENDADHEDQWTSFLEPGKLPLVLDPVVAEVRLTKVLIDGGSGLNLIFASTLRKMGLDFMDMLVLSKSPFYGIVPGNAAHPLGMVVLPGTFGTRENYRTVRHSPNSWQCRIMFICFSRC